jgi:hypothetical protein
MSLGGKLEDLGLGEILSIVGLSRKSGVLFLRKGETEGKIIFKYGQVIYAETNSSPEIQDILLKHRVITPEQIEGMKKEFELLFPSVRTFADFLRENKKFKRSYLEKLLTPYVEEEVLKLFKWDEGRFNLEVVEDEKDLPLYMNPYGLVLDIGVNPQFLAIEGARRRDEEERESAEKRAERVKMEFGEGERMVEKEHPVPQPAIVEKGEYAELRNFAREILNGLNFEIETEDEEEAVNEDIKRLKSYIYELQNPSSGTEITLLILRYASEIMNRAVLFLVRKNEVVGLGQFGVYTTTPNSNAVVRSIKIPLDSPSIFKDVIEKGVSMKKRLRKDGWDKFLVQKLGGIYPVEAFVAPIWARGKIIAILYGDNLPESRKIGNTAGLEIFLSHAGLAMDKAFLERMLREKKQDEKGR